MIDCEAVYFRCGNRRIQRILQKYAIQMNAEEENASENKNSKFYYFRTNQNHCTPTQESKRASAVTKEQKRLQQSATTFTDSERNLAEIKRSDNCSQNAVEVNTETNFVGEISEINSTHDSKSDAGNKSKVNRVQLSIS